jgi:DNA-binding winged helix-turn-helix (wHTH) protein/TolB-like protein/Flp pilus assembly protein TadD
MQAVHLYEFGEFQLDAAERCLLRAGEPVSLTPKAFDTLLLLVSRSGHIVEKDELLREVWPDAFVEEATVAQNIFTLRKALGQAPEGQRFIETIPKRGYRFVANVREVRNDEAILVLEKHTRTEIVTEEVSDTGEATGEGGRTHVVYQQTSAPEGWPAVFDNTGTVANIIEPAAAPQPAQLTGPHASFRRRRLRLYLLAAVALLLCAGAGLAYWQWRKTRQRESALAVKSIAVLPFKPLDADSGNELLGLGMADAIIIRLSKFQRLPVLPTSTIIKYTGRDDDPLALGQALGVDAVLSGTVQRSGDRVRVTVQLLSIDGGNTLWSDKFDEQFTGIFAVQDAISERVTQALALQLTGDQKKELAKRYTGNQEAYQAYIMGLYFYNKRTKEGMERAVEYFNQAVEKDPNYALAHALLADSYYLSVYYGFVREQSREYRTKAREAARRALELDETLAEAHTAMGTILSDFDGNLEGSEREHKRAIELNPNYAIAHLRYGWFLSFRGQMEEVVREMRRAQELDPLSPTTNGALCGSLVMTRQYDESVKYCQRALELEPDVFINLVNLAEGYRLQGKYDQGLAAYQRALEVKKDSADAMAGLALTYAKTARRPEAEKLLAQLQELALRDRRVFYSIALVYAALNDKDRAFEWLEKALDARAVMLRSLRYDPDLDTIRSDPRYADTLKRHSVDALLNKPE